MELTNHIPEIMKKLTKQEKELKMEFYKTIQCIAKTVSDVALPIVVIFITIMIESWLLNLKDFHPFEKAISDNQIYITIGWSNNFKK